MKKSVHNLVTKCTTLRIVQLVLEKYNTIIRKIGVKGNTTILTAGARKENGSFRWRGGAVWDFCRRIFSFFARALCYTMLCYLARSVDSAPAPEAFRYLSNYLTRQDIAIFLGYHKRKAFRHSSNYSHPNIF